MLVRLKLVKKISGSIRCILDKYFECLLFNYPVLHYPVFKQECLKYVWTLYQTNVQCTYKSKSKICFLDVASLNNSCWLELKPWTIRRPPRWWGSGVPRSAVRWLVWSSDSTGLWWECTCHSAAGTHSQLPSAASLYRRLLNTAPNRQRPTWEEQRPREDTHTTVLSIFSALVKEIWSLKMNGSPLKQFVIAFA